jgi:hypothetical protein
MTYKLYIGANNDTKEVETALVERVLNKRHQGYTITPAVGYWLGQREPSIEVLIEDEQTKIMESIAELKDVLKQDAIGFQKVARLQFF